MNLSRRGLVAYFAAGITAASSALADTTDLAVSCDIAVTPAVLKAAQAYRWATGVRVRLFPTMPGLLVPQLQREIQNDLIVTRTATIDRAEALGLIKSAQRAGPWRNRLVIAAQANPTGPSDSFALPGTEIDGPAVLKSLDLNPAKRLEVLDTATVAAMLADGEVGAGLVFQSDIAASDKLKVTTPVPDSAAPPVLYAAAVTTLAYRGDPAAFLRFLGGPDGTAAMRAAGLESVA